jgi:hypothetical protein
MVDILGQVLLMSRFNVTYATLDPATVAAVTLSGGNLVATNTGTTSTNQGVRVADAGGKTSGKYYFEVTVTTGGNGSRVSWGIGTTTSTYANLSASATTGAVMYLGGGIWAGGSSSGSDAGTVTIGVVIGIALDLDNLKSWFRIGPSGNWNGSGTANPATNTGGVTVPAGTMVPFCTFGGTAGSSGIVNTANFGATAFAGVVPSGFTSGWPL